MKRPSATIVLTVLAGALAGGCSRSSGPNNITLTVSVAASLQNAMEELAPAYERSHPGVNVNFNFGGSGTLEQQIERGADADVFLSAAPKPMDALAAKALILPDTRRDLLRNQIVLIVGAGGAKISSFQQLTDGNVKLIALGDPGSVPAGDYGRQVLEALNLWNAVQPKLVLAKDVRQVLSYVETGNADAGIVYATDAHESDKVRVAATAPDNSHTPVVYPIAVLKDCRNIPSARTFVAFLAGSQARDVFARHGFTAVSP
jgi:molybdate transport system substrate-binding protein